MSTDDLATPAELGLDTIPGLDGYKDARAAIRLIQCSRCSLPLRAPLILPCGNSLCKACLPPSHTRENITYPPRTSRAAAINCPFEKCGQAHPLEECSTNVVLFEIVNAVAEAAANQLNLSKQTYETSIEEIFVADEVAVKLETERQEFMDDEKEEVIDAAQMNEKEAMEEKDEKANQLVDDKGDEEQQLLQTFPSSRKLPGGRLVATYQLAQLGELRYTSEVEYGDPEDIDPVADTALLEEVKEFAHKELECRICYFLMNDPITTPCGHSFCRTCLAQVLEHSNLCAACRRTLYLSPVLSSHPSDGHLASILSSFWPNEVKARSEAIQEEQRILSGGTDTPLFICTVGFPHMPTLLHIFEPRYRLMIQRALNTNRCFGMLMYNERGTPQGALGRTDFLQYGILLYIEQYNMFADGRYFISCRGLSRFKVLSHDVLDNYVVGKIQKFDDIALAEEERIEAEETTSSATTATSTSPNTEESPTNLDRLSTQQLHEIGTAFVQQARERSAHWLPSRIAEVYGGPPDDPAIFPYWLASVLPVKDEEKYKLLVATSVREKLKIIAGWVRRIEAQRWYHGSSCTVL